AGVDVIHDHTLAGPLLSISDTGGPPVAVTHHGPFTPDMRAIFGEAARYAATVAISHAQARTASAGPNRSAWSWPRRWHAVRPCWPSPTAPHPRSSTTVIPATCAQTRTRCSPRSTGSLPSTG